VIELHELAGCEPEVEPAAVIFSFAAERAARAGDPAAHDLRAAVDLYLMAADALTARFGERDFPNNSQETPREFVGDAAAVAVWDFDYHQVAVELRRIDPTTDAWAVWVRRVFDGRASSG